MVTQSVTAMLAVLLLAATGLRLSLGQDTDPCSAHATLSEDWRHPETDAAPEQCDTFAEGWYKFTLGKDPAQIPTQCLQDDTCGARVPLHVELDGQDLPQMGANITASLCGSYNVLNSVDCCVQRQPVRIMRCDDETYIYYLKPQTVCPVAVCAVRLNEGIPARYTAKSGDTPRSVSSRDQATVNTVTGFPEICPEGLPECPDGTCGVCASPVATTTAEPLNTTTPQEIVRSLRTMLTASSSTPPNMDTPSPPPPTMDSSTSSSFLPESPSSPTSANPDNSTSTDVYSSEAESSSLPSQDNSSMPWLYDVDNTTATDNVTSVDSDQSTDMKNTTVPDFAGSPKVTTAMDETTTWEASEDNSTMTQNVTQTGPEVSSVDAFTPDLRQSPGSLDTTTVFVPTSATSTPDDVVKASTSASVMPPAQETSASTSSKPVVSSTPVHTVVSSTPVHTDASSTTMAMSSDRSAPVTPGGGLAHTSVPATTTAVESFVEGNQETVRFVLRGPYEEQLFNDTLQVFLSDALHSLTTSSNLSVSVQNLTVISQSVRDEVTVVDLVVVDPLNDGTFAAESVVQVIEREKFAEQVLSEAGLTLLAACPSVDTCDNQAFSDNVHYHDHSLFKRNQPVFIAVIVVAAVSLLLLLLGLLFIRYRRQGTWVLAPDYEEKEPEPWAVDSPLTDQQILQEEGRVAATTTTITNTSASTLPVNGDRPHVTLDEVDLANNDDDSIPAADEDNGWVVPLDQAPTPPPDGLAVKTEDTQF